MKLKKGFIVHDTGSESILVPMGGVGWSGVVKGNKTLGAILDLLKADTTEAAIIDAMRKGPAGCDSKSIRERLLKEIVTPLLGEKGLDDVDRVDNITVYPDGRLIVTIDDEEIERVWR